MELIVMSVIAFLFWLMQGIFYQKFWSGHLSASVAFGRSFVTEGETSHLTETITNAKVLPLPVLHVKFQMGKHLVFTQTGNSTITDQNYRSDIFSCMPWQEIRRKLEFRCEKRGYYCIRQMDLSSYDLFFSNHFAAAFPVHTSMYVYPGPADSLRLNLPLRSLMGQILANRSLIQDPFEFQSLRPYQSYDPYRNVNWKATAHTGDLKVNVYTPTSSWQVLFLLDVDSDRLWKDEDLTEEAIRLCGSYGSRLMEEGIPVSICTNGSDCLTGQPGFLESGAGISHNRSMMELLSRIQTTESAAPASAHPRPCMETLLEDLLQQNISGSGGPAAHNRIYLLISPRQHPALLHAFDALCGQCPGSQWIVPLRPGEPLRLSTTANVTLFQWEVPYGRS